MPKEVYESGKGSLLGYTETSEIDGENGELRHRGYSIEDLARQSDFVEITALLLNGELPSKREREEIEQILGNDDLRELDGSDEILIHNIVDRQHDRGEALDPMIALQSLVATLGLSRPQHGFDPLIVRKQGLELLAKLPALTAGILRISRWDRPITPGPKEFAANLLWMLNGQEPDQEDAELLDTLLLLHADHGYNNSAFTGRVAISSGAAVASTLSAAIGALNGSRHGGASRDTFALLETMGSPESVEGYIREQLAQDPSWKFPGCGHRIYTTTDPRARLIKPIAKRLCEKHGLPWFAIAEKYERVAIEILHNEMGKDGVWPNVDLFAATAFGVFVPLAFITALFAIGRTPGYLAQMMEELKTGAIFRPDGKYRGPWPRAYVPKEQRPQATSHTL